MYIPGEYIFLCTEIALIYIYIYIGCGDGWSCEICASETDCKKCNSSQIGVAEALPCGCDVDGGFYEKSSGVCSCTDKFWEINGHCLSNIILWLGELFIYIYIYNIYINIYRLWMELRDVRISIKMWKLQDRTSSFNSNNSM